jgi:hypothetical protein
LNWERFLLSAFPFIFAIFWLGILHWCAWMGGWTRLARQFTDDPMRGDQRDTYRPIRRAWFQSGSLGMMNYKSCLNVGVYETGVRLSVLWPFRPGHPPLFIPWSELAEGREKRLMFLFKRLEVFVGEPPVKVLLPVWVRDYIPADDGELDSDDSEMTIAESFLTPSKRALP